MTWHELLSLTPELKKKIFTVCVNVLQRTSIKNGEPDELLHKCGNVYDTINFTKME